MAWKRSRVRISPGPEGFYPSFTPGLMVMGYAFDNGIMMEIT